MMLDNKDNIHVASGEVMGGPWQLRHIPHPDVSPDKVAAGALDALQRVDRQMSNYNPDSDLMRLNAAPLDTWVEVPSDLYRVMAAAQIHAQMSNGALNIALGQLVNRWGFGPDAKPLTWPDSTKITQEISRATLGSYMLQDDPSAVFKTADISFDLCALAKGFAVDQAARVVEALGITDFLVEAAGEIFARGNQPNGTPWSVGLELPVPSEEILVFDEIVLDGFAVATSGGYRNRHKVDGVDVCHTIDPQSGAPLESALLSVTVLHPECMHADALATVLYVLGPEKGPEFAADRNVAALFLIRVDNGLREIRSEAFVAITRR